MLFPVCVKAELGRPSLLQPDKGKVAIHVDCSPTAAPMFEGRGGEELSTELSIALLCCLLGAKSGAGAGIDLSSLIVVMGKICWDLHIDCLYKQIFANVIRDCYHPAQIFTFFFFFFFFWVHGDGYALLKFLMII